MPSPPRTAVAPALRGIWAAVPTPFAEDGAVDLDGVRRNARHYADSLHLSGIFCNGLMGEGWALDLDERQAIVDSLQAETGGRLALAVVVTHHSLGETIRLARHAEDAGADHVVLMRPREAFRDDEIYGYVIAVREAVGMPIILFESPTRAFGAHLVARLADEGAIAGVKATAGLEAAIAMRDACEDRVPVMDPLEANWLTHLTRFDVPVLYADPEPYLFQSPYDRPIAAYHRAHAERNLEEAWRISASLEGLRRVYERWIMGPLRRGAAPNAALKEWCSLMSLASGPVRAPLAPLTAAEKLRLRAELLAAGVPLAPHDMRPR